MAIDKGTETLAIRAEERTWRTNIETPLGGEPVITVYREVIKLGPNGDVIARDNLGGTVLSSSAHSDLVAQVEVVADAERSSIIATKAAEAAAAAAAVSA